MIMLRCERTDDSLWWRRLAELRICHQFVQRLFAIVVLTTTVFATPVDAEQSRPNVLFILADDLAWADLRCYGHPWHSTPHLDHLAKQGMRFTNAYAPAPICSASRASILTGKTTARLNFEFVTKDEAGFQKLDTETPLRAPPYTLNLPLAETTIPEVLAASGYQTAFFGKWHLNAHYQKYLGWSPTYGPSQQGFQIAVEDFGSHPYSWGKIQPQQITDSGRFPVDSMIRQVVDFVGSEHDGPWFAMASQFYVHTPVKTPCLWLVEKYERLIPADVPARAQRIQYAAFVETLDHYVGELLAAVDHSDAAKDTLVVFTSDNGGHPEFTANGPLRGSKWNLYEGGIRVPLIARWPDRISAGEVCKQPVIGYDLLATFADVAGVAVPENDGVSLIPVLTQQTHLEDRALIWHFPYYHPERGFAKAADAIGVNDFVTSRTRPQSSIRMGQYKLLQFYEDDRVELYNLESDPSEQHDLSDQQPKLATQLRQQLNRRLESMHARLPKPVAGQ